MSVDESFSLFKMHMYLSIWTYPSDTKLEFMPVLITSVKRHQLPKSVLIMLLYVLVPRFNCNKQGTCGPDIEDSPFW